jgi:hypothetical protein
VLTIVRPEVAVLAEDPPVWPVHGAQACAFASGSATATSITTS